MRVRSGIQSEVQQLESKKKKKRGLRSFTHLIVLKKLLSSRWEKKVSLGKIEADEEDARVYIHAHN